MFNVKDVAEGVVSAVLGMYEGVNPCKDPQFYTIKLEARAAVAKVTDEPFVLEFADNHCMLSIAEHDVIVYH